MQGYTTQSFSNFIHIQNTKRHYNAFLISQFQNLFLYTVIMHSTVSVLEIFLFLF